MKKKLLLTALLATSIWAFMSGCKQEVKNYQYSIDGYDIVIIDSCEYILKESGFSAANNYSFALTHKGNCKFCRMRATKTDIKID